MIENIKNIIFDFGGVLVDLDKPRCIEAFNRIGFPQAATLVDSYYQQGIFCLLETGKITPDAFCNEVRAMTGNTASDKEIWNAWNLLLAGIPAYRLEALLELGKHYTLYLLSNTNQIHWEYSAEHHFKYQGHTVNDYFKQIFLSYEMHMAKPDTAIFTEVIKQSGVDLTETLFIDDSHANCEAARSVGLNSYHLKPEEDWRNLFKEKLF